MNKLPDKVLDSIMQQGETPLTLKKDLEFIKQRQVTMLSEDNLNKVLGCNFNVKEKHFISLFQIMKDDGYSHDITPIKYLTLNNIKKDKYTCQGQYEKVLFNKLLLLNNDRMVILNSKDYIQLKKEINKNDIGHIKLFNFKDWKKTASIVNKLSSQFDLYNKSKDRAFELAARISDYTTYEKSGSFLLFMLFFVSILFFLASNVMLHFKLLTEFEREKLKYKKIYKIGITRQEVTRIISKELKVIFFLPVLFGVVIGTLFSYGINLSYGNGISGAVSSLSIGGTYVLFQGLTYFIYRKCYINKLFRF